MKLSAATIVGVFALAASTVSAVPMYGYEVEEPHRGPLHEKLHEIKCDAKRDWECFKRKVRHEDRVVQQDLRQWKYVVHEDVRDLKWHIHRHIYDFDVRFERFKRSLEYHLEYAARSGIHLLAAGAHHIEHGVADIQALDELLADDIIYHIYYMWDKLAEIDTDVRTQIFDSYVELVNQINGDLSLRAFYSQQQSCESALLTIADVWETRKSMSHTIIAFRYGAQITTIYEYLYKHTHTVTVTNPQTGRTTIEQDSETVRQTEVDQTAIGGGAPFFGYNLGSTYAPGRTYVAHGLENKEAQEETVEDMAEEGELHRGPVVFEG